MANPRRVVLAGGTGLVGRHLTKALAAQGDQVALVSHAMRPGTFSWDELPQALAGAEAVVNLAGEGIAERRWSRARKEALLRSRVDTTRNLVWAMAALPFRPRVLVNASAVGIYGDLDGRSVAEDQPPGKGFLAQVCQQWEETADLAAACGVRVVKLRLGVVLAADGGALPRMAAPIRWFLGAKLGHGQQGFSWIHIEDVVRMVVEALDDDAWMGAYNATAPRPLTNESFSRALARALKRPLLPVPGFLTRAAILARYGEMGREALLGGAMVYPRRALGQGFAFAYERVEDALASLMHDGELIL